MCKNVLEVFIEEAGIQSKEGFYSTINKWMEDEKDWHSNALAIYMLQIRILELLGDC